MEKLKNIVLAFFMAGVIVLMTGLYYEFIKAGIPYQDAPLELQINYAINYGIGETLTKIGSIIAGCGGIVCLILKWLNKAADQ